MKAVIYARYSSHAQREESIEGQLRECYSYARRNGIDVLKEYVDRAQSATTDQRPAFQQMIAESSGGAFDTVLVYALDRFSRERYDAAVYKKKLKNNGVKIVSVTQPIDDSPEGVLIESLLEGLAEYYSKNLARGVVRGMRENALSCRSVGGLTPTGYKVDPDTKKYVIDEPQAAVIREIFNMYADGSSIAAICKYCNAHCYRTSRGRPFTRSSLNAILRSRKYIGVYIYDDIEIPGGMPVIVDEHTFKRVQERIAMGHRSRPRDNGDDVDFILTGKLYCGHCGRPMVGTSGTGKAGKIYYYYTCRNHGNKCTKHNERKDPLEDFIIDYIVDHFLTPKNVEEIAVRIMDVLDNDAFAMSMRSLEDQIRDKDRRISNLMKAIEFSGDVETYSGRIEEIKAEKHQLEIELSNKRIENLAFLDKDIITAWMLSFADGDRSSKEYQHRLIDTFVNAIYIYDNDGSGDDGKRKIVIAFNSSGPEAKVTLECSDRGSDGPPLKHCPNTGAYIVRGGRVIVVVLDY